MFLSRYALMAMAAVAVLSAGWGTIQTLRSQSLALKVANLTTSLASAEATITFERRGRVIADQALERMKADREITQRAVEALLTGDFANADAPLDPAVVTIVECLRRRNKNCIR